MRLLVLCSLVTSATLVCGCQIVNRDRHTTEYGRSLSRAESASIAINRTTGDELIAAVGQPTSRVDRPDGTSTWKWCQTRTDTSSGHGFLLWDRDSSRTKTTCTRVELTNNIVTAVHSD
jgi:hypothetical protein